MSRRRGRRSRAVNRRRLIIGSAVVAAGVTAGVLLGVVGKVDDAIQELTLPLRHEDIIRQQAAEKDIDASLVAAVIYAESRFRDQTSDAGARGLMQITPETALDIAKRSEAQTFVLKDLGDPQINISYGTYHLRDLLDQYEGNVIAALAAYNAGSGNVDRWGGADLTLDDIRFPETRGYVEDVLDKQHAYQDKYGEELGYR
jgi:soluble lytic murein transglycosylase